MLELSITIGIVLAVIVFVLGIRIVRPTERGLVERLGKYKYYVMPGFNWIIPVIDRMIKVDITERMVDSERQEIITKDKLNAKVDAQVYYKINDNEDDVKASQYNAKDVRNQIVSLARTTLRNIIGTMSLSEANSERDKINLNLKKALEKETASWGIDIVRTELKEIEPPRDVQEAMNAVVKAENQKTAAVDFATAAETEADGARRAKIKLAQGQAQAIKLEAEAKAEAIKKVNEAVETSFTEKAQILRKLEAAEKCLEKNTKIVVPSSDNLVNLIGNLGGTQ